MSNRNWFNIPTERLFNFRIKDMKKIIDSPKWDAMHDEIGIELCDYPNHNCIMIKELKCEDCDIYNKYLTIEKKGCR